MPLMDTPNGDGNFTIYLKYNAKAGRWYTKDDKPEAAEYEVTNMTAVFDLANVKTGWFLFAAGVAPVKQFDPSLSVKAEKPGDGFKRGFEMLVFSDKNLGGVREFASTAGAVIESINTLYDAFLAAPESGAGKLPVVKCSGVQPVTGKHGTNYSPTLEIVSWVDRPDALKTGEAAPAAVSAPPPPAPPAAQVPAMAGAEADF